FASAAHGTEPGVPVVLLRLLPEQAPDIWGPPAVAFDSASQQAAGEITLRNTPQFLVNSVERASLELARKARLCSYNDYREYAHFPRVKVFNEITGDEALQRALRDVYGSPDNVEFFVGLSAEDVQENSAVPMMLLGRLVTVDAFSQALTNPL